MNSNQQFQPFLNLDLDLIKTKLMHEESGEGWSAERAEAVATEYRRFLFLMKRFPEDDTAPAIDVDTFWHYHILDTMKYAADCDQLFGYFLHHYPYVGMRGEGDEAVRQDSAERMRLLYEETFGEPYLASMTSAAANASAYCGAGTHAAYCGAGTQAAYCGAGAKSAYCGAGTRVAYCGAGTKAAYCGAGTKTAYCGAGTKAADCGAGTKVAYCGAGTQAACGAGTNAAYCGAGARAATSGAGIKTAYCGVAGVIAGTAQSASNDRLLLAG